MANPNLIRNFIAEAAVGKFLIVKPGSADGLVAPGAAAADKLIGVSSDIDAAINERCDVILDGIADVIYGGAVTRGDLLTSDANGKAVTAAPGAGANNRIIGTALVSGVLNDVGQVNIAPSMMQG